MTSWPACCNAPCRRHACRVTELDKKGGFGLALRCFGQNTASSSIFAFPLQLALSARSSARFPPASAVRDREGVVALRKRRDSESIPLKARTLRSETYSSAGPDRSTGFTEGQHSQHLAWHSVTVERTRGSCRQDTFRRNSLDRRLGRIRSRHRDRRRYRSQERRWSCSE